MPSSAVKQKKSGEKQKKSGGNQGVAIVLGVFALMVLAAILMYLYTVRGSQVAPEPVPTVEATATASPEASPVDNEPPVIEGARDLTVAVGAAPSYRSGVTATDETDGKVKLDIDASAVNLSQPGEYTVFYRATDKAGNRAETSITVTVVEVAGVNDDDPTADVSGEEVSEVELPPISEVTEDMVNEEADRILAKILSPSMNQWEQTQAIYNYVHTKVKYVGTSDKSSWLMGAYVGFTRGRGDCYNYFACSKALLTRAGIPNVDLYRVGGNTDHYWQLVNVGSGWYHFDACPHPASYPLGSFLLDEMAVREYTEKCAAIRTNYYVYDYANCPVVPVGFPVEELPAESEAPVESMLPTESETPVESLLPADGEVPDESEAPDEIFGETGENTPAENVPQEEEAILPPGAISPAQPLPTEEAPAPKQETVSPDGMLTKSETSGKDELL